MVTRNQSASQGGGREPSQQHETNEDAKMVDEFVIKLAQALQRRGKRTWKVKFAHSMSILKCIIFRLDLPYFRLSCLNILTSIVFHTGTRGI